MDCSLSHALSRGPGPQPRHMPWPAIKPATFGSQAGAQSTRANLNLKFKIFHPLSKFSCIISLINAPPQSILLSPSGVHIWLLVFWIHSPCLLSLPVIVLSYIFILSSGKFSQTGLTSGISHLQFTDTIALIWQQCFSCLHKFSSDYFSILKKNNNWWNALSNFEPFFLFLSYVLKTVICSDHSNHSLFIWFLLEIHWLIKLHRFQVYNSIMYHLYIVLCVHHHKSSLLSPFIPFTLFHLPHLSLPLVITILLSMPDFFS